MRNYLILSLTGLLGLASCAKESVVTPINPSPIISEHSLLVQRLQSVNDSLLLQGALSTEPRGIWSRVAKFLTVSAADIGGAYEIGGIGAKVGAIAGPKGAVVGAAIGGTIGAVGASYGAYRGVRGGYSVVEKIPDADLRNAQLEKALQEHLEEYPSSTLPLVLTAYSITHTPEARSLSYKDGEALGLSKEFAHCIDLSKEHNAMLEIIQNKKNRQQDLYSLSAEEVRILFHPSLLKAYEQSPQIATKILSQRASDNYLESKVMKLFLSIYKQYPNSKEDIEELVKLYIGAIQASNELNKQEKEVILQALPVALASFSYWEENL